MNSILKKEQFCQVKQSIRKNRKYLLIGIDVSKKSSTACFYNIEKEILLKKYLVSHDIESFRKFIYKIEQIMEINNFQDVIIGVEPTANYHKPISEYLRKKNYFMGRIQCASATKELAASIGVLNPKHFLGRLFNADSINMICSFVILLKSVPFGKYQRISPLVFSLVPRSHE